MKLFHLTSCAPHRAEIVRWVSESKRPFKIITDRAFRSLMKTGRLEYPIPSAETVSRDVRNVFVNVRKRLAKILEDFRISDKVSNSSCGEDIINSLDTCRFSRLPATMHRTTTQ